MKGTVTMAMKSTRREKPPTWEVRTVTKRKHDSKVQVCSLHFHIHSANRRCILCFTARDKFCFKTFSYVILQGFLPRLHDLYIDLIRKMIICDTWYKFLEIY